MTASLGLFFLFSSFKTTKKHIVQRFLPKPGEGPIEKIVSMDFLNSKYMEKLSLQGN